MDELPPWAIHSSAVASDERTLVHDVARRQAGE
jgi:hypothetical protein